MNTIVKGILQRGGWGIIIFALGGLGGVFFEHLVLPYAATFPSLTQWPLLRQATASTTIINKTEQVIIREDDSVERIASQAAATVVNIISVARPAGGGSLPSHTEAAQGPLLGSGVLLTNDGVIATYRKTLLEQNAAYTVLLYNGQSYPARLMGIDELTQLAYLKIDADNVPAIAFADSDDMRPGRKLIGLANASEEYQNRFSTGLLSNFNKTFNLSAKTVASSEKWEGVFETDFTNQTHFVGGPVINFGGELVGIVGSETLDHTVQYFLIPSNAVKQSLTLAIRDGLATRPALGVYYLTITKAYALSHALERDRGALIFSPSGQTTLAVITGSPADRAGLQAGDIVIAVNGEEVNLAHPLSVIIGNLKAGERAELLVLRGGTEQKVTVQL